MKSLSRMIAAVRNLLHTGKVESDLDAELRAYVDAVTAERIAAGMTPEMARRTSLADFGGTEPVKQAVRDSRAGTGIDDLAGRTVRSSHTPQIARIHSCRSSDSRSGNRSQHSNLHSCEFSFAAGDPCFAS